jgi:hypothetical protein
MRVADVCEAARRVSSSYTATYTATPECHCKETATYTATYAASPECHYKDIFT